MARRKRQYKRELKPDPKYGNLVVSKFINSIMERGKKGAARKTIYNTLGFISTKLKKDPIEIFDLALKNVAPDLEIKGRRIGGANYQIPYEVRGDRKQTLAFRWIIEAAKAKKGQPMSIRLATEIIDAAKNQGSAVRKKEDSHRMARANKAFAHFAR
ncbi:MAG: 30S ribosomal protein S7 [Patescibacteria group bacterium]|nr:30S ribosomal protein S7 [Patescibacteria group bacterium]